MSLKRLKSIGTNFALLVGSLVFVFLIFELIIFRLVLKASDFPRVQTVDQIIKYKPNQTGIFRVKAEIAANYAVNSNGWNSGHSAYTRHKAPDKKRMAIIGDSYIEAFGVDYDQSVAEQLERRLDPDRFQVYRFGIGGAPMSQYLHMLRQEVTHYQPDLVIINLAHNDFVESYTSTMGLYQSYFLKLEIKNGQVVSEIPPQMYHPRWYTPIRYSAIWRYLHIRRGIRFDYLKDMLFTKQSGKYQANIDITNLGALKQHNTVATDYLFRNIKQTCEQNKSRLLIMMDGDRGRIYAQTDDLLDYDRGVLTLNRIAQKTAQKYAIDFIDLHPVFLKEYDQHGQRFNIEKDGHWNFLGHRTVANQIYEYLMQNQHLLL